VYLYSALPENTSNAVDALVLYFENSRTFIDRADEADACSANVRMPELDRGIESSRQTDATEKARRPYVLSLTADDNC